MKQVIKHRGLIAPLKAAVVIAFRTDLFTRRNLIRISLLYNTLL